MTKPGKEEYKTILLIGKEELDKILLEDVYVFESGVVPVCIFDLRVHLFPIMEAYYRNQERLEDSTDLLQDWMMANWALVFNNPFPWIANQPDRGWFVIVVDDWRDGEADNYWRNDIVLAEGFPEYKGNRGGYEERPQIYFDIHQSALTYLSTDGCPIPLFRQPTFEADDWAGVAYRQTKGKNPIFLNTVDNDWLQLVDDNKQVLFACSRFYKPRLRSEYEALMWAKGKGWLISSPREIADMKSIYGDEGDNLMPGSPIGVIDLINPTRKPDPILEKKLGSFLEPESSNVQTSHAESAYVWLLKNNFQ